MSGTSFDGVDVSLITTNGQDVYEVKDNLYEKFNDQLKSNLKKLKNSFKNYKDLDIIKENKLFIEVENQVTDLHIKLIKELILKFKEKINIIGFMVLHFSMMLKINLHFKWKYKKYLKIKNTSSL